MDNRPIGIMDSGVGGLTVAAALRRVRPEESILYIGDSRRNPYGKRTPEEITRFAEEMKAFLIGKGVKAILVACNTITFNTPRSFYEGPVPVTGMSTDFSSLPKVKKAAVFATPASIASHSHRRGLEAAQPGAAIAEVPCDGLAHAIETGAPEAEIREILQGCIRRYGAEDAGAAVLGCTHYPLVRPLFEELMPETVFCDPAEQTVAETLRRLEADDALAESCGDDVFYFTAAAEEAAALTEKVFGKTMPVRPAEL